MQPQFLFQNTDTLINSSQDLLSTLNVNGNKNPTKKILASEMLESIAGVVIDKSYNISLGVVYESAKEIITQS